MIKCTVFGQIIPGQEVDVKFKFVAIVFLIILLLTACNGGEVQSLPDVDKEESLPITSAAPSRSAPPTRGVQTAPQVDEIFAAFVGEDTPGGAVLVAQDGQALYQAAYGMANLETGETLTTDHRFHFGSAGKQFTGLAVLMLYEEGLLELDDPIGKHLPELAQFGDEVTIRRLLHHMSGIPDYYEDEDLYDQLLEIAKNPTNADALELLSGLDEVIYEPGSEYFYSNTGYEVLGSLVERLSGQPFNQFLQERIFDPLEMKNTFSQPNPKRLREPLIAMSYAEGEEAYPEDDFDNLTGSGSVYTTLGDLLKYDNALYTDQLVSQETQAQAFELAVMNDGQEYPYGFGWDVDEHDGLLYQGHEGAWLAFLSDYLRFPEQRLVVIVLLNRDYDVPELRELSLQIADLYLK